MLPSSSGPGRCPPQGGNGGSSPSGSANLPIATYYEKTFGKGVKTTLCPKQGATQWTCEPFECICHLGPELRRKDHGPECGENEHN